MKFNKKNKKGFTIVELVIVLAVIGILTAILVPTFVNLVNNAQRAENQTFVKNLNTQMAVLENDPTYKIKDEETGEDIIIGGENHTMYDAIIDAKEIGHDVEKLTPVNNNEIIWDSVANRFAIVTSAFDPANPTDKSTVVYSDGGIKGKNHELWKIYTPETMPANQTFSIYAKKDAWNVANTASGVSITGQGDETKVSVSGLKVGFDVGFNKNFASISYTRAASEPAQTVSIRGAYGTEISIDAPKDVVHQYGTLGSGVVKRIASSSLHVHGQVGYMELASGRVVADGGHVHTIVLVDKENDSDADAYIQIANGGSFENKYAISNDVASANNTKNEGKEGGVFLTLRAGSNKGEVLLTAEQEELSGEDRQKAIAAAVSTIKQEAIASVTPEPEVIGTGIGSYEQLAQAFENGGDYYLVDDISISNGLVANKSLAIDFNGHSIIVSEGAKPSKSTDCMLSIIGDGNALTFNGKGTLVYATPGAHTDAVVGGFSGASVVINGGTFLSLTDYLSGGVGVNLVINGGKFLGSLGTFADSTLTINVPCELKVTNDMLPFTLIGNTIICPPDLQYTITGTDWGSAEATIKVTEK